MHSIILNVCKIDKYEKNIMAVFNHLILLYFNTQQYCNFKKLYL